MTWPQSQKWQCCLLCCFLNDLVNGNEFLVMDKVLHGISIKLELTNSSFSKTYWKYLLFIVLNGPVFLLPLSLGPFLEIGEERDHCLGREIISRLDPSLGLVGKIFNDELFKTLYM